MWVETTFADHPRSARRSRLLNRPLKGGAAHGAEVRLTVCAARPASPRPSRQGAKAPTTAWRSRPTRRLSPCPSGPMWLRPSSRSRLPVSGRPRVSMCYSRSRNLMVRPWRRFGSRLRKHRRVNEHVHLLADKDLAVAPRELDDDLEHACINALSAVTGK